MRPARPGEILISQTGSPVEAQPAGVALPDVTGMVPGTVVRPAGAGAADLEVHCCPSAPWTSQAWKRGSVDQALTCMPLRCRAWLPAEVSPGCCSAGQRSAL